MPQEADRITFGFASSMRVASSFGGEAAEHHRMDRADAGAGEHADHRLRDHRHVEDDPVALATPRSWSTAPRVATSSLQLRIGDVRFVPVTGLS